ncbi:hypothetical protein Fmac_001877 [Flemingia macrophylla]|uniref:Uncharacterized protein n=1 Tax=Flemingia macrophylla TaxID=520843 RepID=A0ABD1NIB7_9FABA
MFDIRTKFPVPSGPSSWIFFETCSPISIFLWVLHAASNALHTRTSGSKGILLIKEYASSKFPARARRSTMHR